MTTKIMTKNNIASMNNWVVLDKPFLLSKSKPDWL